MTPFAGIYASENAVISDALDRLRQTMPAAGGSARKQAKRAKAAPKKPKNTLALAEIHQQMLASGLMTQLPDANAYFDDPEDKPITIKGEPISETSSASAAENGAVFLR